MERADLERLPPGKLIDLILAQQAVIEQLRARLAQPAKTPANSSVPPAHGYKPQRKPPADGARKRGPKHGHRGTTRLPSVPDVQIMAKVAQCARCGHEVGALEQPVVARRQVTDLPPIQPVVIEARVCQVVCPECGQRQKATFPDTFRAPQSFGPVIQALLRRSEQLAREREALSPEQFAARKQDVYRQSDALLAADTAHPEGQRLQRRYRRHRDKLFVFLERPDVPYDNNGWERDLCNSVIHRPSRGRMTGELPLAVGTPHPSTEGPPLRR